MDYLNDLEKELVEAFYKNETQREAVRKIILAGVYSNGVLVSGKPANAQKNWALSLTLSGNENTISNEQLGANLRAVSEGLRVVELAFQELSNIKKAEPIKQKINKAR